MVATATKIDYTKQLAHLYRTHDEPELVEVPPLHFVMVDGHGDPERSDAFREAVEALYAVAYGLKFRIRKLHGIDYGVMPLEGLWWIPHARVWDFADKSDWDWTLMVMQPDMVTGECVDAAVEEAGREKRLPGLERLRFEVYVEGPAAQVLHKGPYAKERPTLEHLYAFIREQGYLPTGKHHEIYLSDPHRATPGRMRTVIRQAVVPLHRADG